MIEHRTLSESAQSMDDVLRFALVKEGTDEVKFRKLTESDKKSISSALLSKVVESIKNKTLQIDYSAVAATGGDITKGKFFADLSGSISFLSKMHNSQPNAPKEIPELERCLQLLVKHKREFTLGFDQENELITYLYNNIVVSLLAATTLLISTSVEYVKDSLGMYQAIFKRNVQDNAGMEMCLDAIRKINKYEAKGLLKSFFDSTFKADNFAVKGFNAGSVTSFFEKNKALGITMTAIASIALVIFVLREVVYFYYWSRNLVSTKLEQLSLFVAMNATVLGDDKKDVKDKQEKIAKRLMSLSEKISVESKVSGKKASDEIRKEDSGRNVSGVASEGDLL